MSGSHFMTSGGLVVLGEPEVDGADGTARHAGPLPEFHCLLDLPGVVMDNSPEPPELGIARVELQPRFERSPRLLETPRAKLADPQYEIGPVVARRQFDRLLRFANGVRGPPPLSVERREHLMAHGVVRVQRERPARVGLGAVEQLRVAVPQEE